MRIEEVKVRTPDLLERLLEVWENSVRATHLFLSDDEIDYSKISINFIKIWGSFYSIIRYKI